MTIAVIKDKAVPRRIPFLTNASIIGMTLTELAYNGAPNNVAKGIAHQLFDERYFSTNDAGTNP